MTRKVYIEWSGSSTQKLCDSTQDVSIIMILWEIESPSPLCNGQSWVWRSRTVLVEKWNVCTNYDKLLQILVLMYSWQTSNWQSQVPTYWRWYLTLGFKQVLFSIVYNVLPSFKNQLNIFKGAAQCLHQIETLLFTIYSILWRNDQFEIFSRSEAW